MDPFILKKDGGFDPNYQAVVGPELGAFVIENGEFPDSTFDFDTTDPVVKEAK